jgi:hypothetical protein
MQTPFVFAALAGIFFFARIDRWLLAFASSCLFLTAMLFGAAAGLYPTVLPSSVNPALDLTIQKVEAGPPRNLGRTALVGRWYCSRNFLFRVRLSDVPRQSQRLPFIHV